MTIVERDGRPSDEYLLDVVKLALRRGGDFAEVFFEKCSTLRMDLSQGKISETTQGSRIGMGIRVVCGEEVGCAHTNDFSAEAVRRAADSAFKMVGHAMASADLPTMPVRTMTIPDFEGAPSLKARADVLRSANECVWSLDDRIVGASCTYWEEDRTIAVVNSNSRLARDRQMLKALHVQVTAQNHRNRSSGLAGAGGQVEMEYFKRLVPEDLARRAVHQAIIKLSSVDAPAGVHTVVIDRGWGGMWAHEAVGHGLEGDFIRRRTSPYSGLEGKRVASPLVTLVDDGTLPGMRGTTSIDDEGTPTQRNVLIEKGVLKSYLYDSFNAVLCGAVSTGNARRADFTQIPLPRMTNTFIEPGDEDPGDIVKSVQKGLFIRALGGGQVDITTGHFVFEIQEGYLIEDGEITHPIRGANLIGYGPEVLMNITAVGRDFEIESGMGTCQKESQNLAVGVGQPTIRIDAMTVGGTRL